MEFNQRINFTGTNFKLHMNAQFKWGVYRQINTISMTPHKDDRPTLTYETIDKCTRKQKNTYNQKIVVERELE